MFVSGTYNSKEREIELTIAYMERNGYSRNEISVKKCADADAADAEVILPNGRRITFEVKEEASYRWTRYGELGIDMISSFKYKSTPSEDWTRPHRGSRELDRLLSEIDIKKWGKISYSKADVWLFAAYSDNNNSQVDFLEGYHGDEIKSLGKWMKENCAFAVNRKPSWQGSYADNWESAVFFVKPRDLERYRVTSI